MKLFKKVKNCVSTFMLLSSGYVYSAIPQAPSELTNNADNWVAGLLEYIKVIFLGGLTVSIAGGSIIGIGSTWSSYKQAVKTGEWTTFGISLSITIVVLGLTLFVAGVFRGLFD